MSNRVMTYPRSRRESEWMVTQRHHSTRRGVMSDGARTNVPLDGVWESINVLLFGDREETRKGTRVLGLSMANLPALKESYSTVVMASKSGTTVTLLSDSPPVGGSNTYPITSANVGDYFVWPDGDHELITAVLTTGVAGTFTVDSSTAHTSSFTSTPVNEPPYTSWRTGTGRIREELNAAIWDKINKKHVILLGSVIYHADWDCTAWTEAWLQGSVAPANAKSNFFQRDGHVYLNNSAGMFMVSMSETNPVVFKVNNTTLTPQITDVAKTVDKIYGRRYTITKARMTENYFLTSYEDNIVQNETAPWSPDSNGKDYSEVYTSAPVGDGTSTSSIIVGGTLQSTADDPSEWEALGGGQFGLVTTLGSTETTTYITVSLVGISTWSELTDRIQAAIRDYFTAAECSYVDDHIEIDLNDPGGSFISDYCVAGDGPWTDIHGSAWLRMDSVSYASITTQSIKAPSTISITETPTGYTHYRLYTTKDVGVNGTDSNTGVGNNTELYIHNDDIPVVEAFVASLDTNGNVTITTGRFKRRHVGETIYFNNGYYAGSYTHSSATITEYVSSNAIKCDKTGSTLTNTGASIGGSKPGLLDQSGTTVTLYNGDVLPSGNSMLFLSDGGILTYNKASGVVLESGTRTGIAYASADLTTRTFSDTVSDDVLSTRISKYWLKNRFWEPIPNCDLGVEVDGFIVSAVSDTKAIYETQLANPHFVGYYDPEFQVDIVQDSIQALREYPGLVSAICSQSTTSWSTELTETDSRPEVGLSTTFLSQKKVVDHSIGTNSPNSIVSVSEGIDILFTNGSEVRLFDGKSYGPNLAEGKTMKLLRLLQCVSAASYDPIGGYYIWGTNGSLTTIGSVSMIPFPDVCHRFAIREEQGVIGGIQIDGNDWLMPPHGICGYEVTDDDSHAMQAVFDNRSGEFYWISTYNGPTGSGLSETFVDKDDGAGTGTEIDWSVTYGADTGSLMKYDIRHEVSNLTIDPFDPANVGAAGYDSDGFRSGLEVNVYAYGRANEWASPYSQSLNIIKDGDITLDETQQKDDKAIQIKITGNRSECVISELVNYYTVIEQAATPTNRATSEGTYQLNLATPVLWLSRGPSLYKNRATGSIISGTATGVTGVDGKSNSAFQVSSALSTISVALTSGSVLLWTDGTVHVDINGESVSLTSVGTSGSWTLYYATGITKTGTFVLTPSGTRKIEDVRVYNSEIASATRTYLYNDMVRNSGDNTLPLW